MNFHAVSMITMTDCCSVVTRKGGQCRHRDHIILFSVMAAMVTIDEDEMLHAKYVVLRRIEKQERTKA